MKHSRPAIKNHILQKEYFLHLLLNIKKAGE